MSRQREKLVFRAHIHRLLLKVYIELFTTLHWHLQHVHFFKRNLNLILEFDLRIFYFVSKSDCSISTIVFQTTVKLCSKIEIISSSQSKLTSTKKMTESAKSNYAQVIKLDLTFLALVSIFGVFCSLLNSRRRLEDGQTKTICKKWTSWQPLYMPESMLNSKKNWIPKG